MMRAAGVDDGKSPWMIPLAAAKPASTKTLQVVASFFFLGDVVRHRLVAMRVQVTSLV